MMCIKVIGASLLHTEGNLKNETKSYLKNMMIYNLYYIYIYIKVDLSYENNTYYSEDKSGKKYSLYKTHDRTSRLSTHNKKMHLYSEKF